MSYAGLGQDKTAQDWATGIRAGGELVSSIISAATRGPGSPTSPTTSSTDAATTYSPPYAVPESSSSSSWTIPLVVGGIAIVGIGAFILISRKSVKENRGRGRRRK